MSRTREREGLERPTKKYIKLSGDTGNFGYWDKEIEKNIELEYPIRFIVLDILTTIKGWHGSKEAGIYSNEIHNQLTEILKVGIFKNGELATGLYADIKEKVKGVGGKFANSVYAMMVVDNEPELVNFQLLGAPLSAFFDFKKDNDIYKNAINIVDVMPAKKGKTDYFIPVFEANGITAEESKAADLLDIELQKYLDKYKLGQLDSSKVEEVPDDEKDEFVPDESTAPIDNSDTPFEVD